MKKLFLALLSVATITAANAQKNSVLVYGTAAFEHRDQDVGNNVDMEWRSWHVMPGIGYQFHKNMTVGVQGGYMQGDVETEFNYLPNARLSLVSDYSEWNAGAFYRYTHYFNQLFAIWGQVNLGYISGDATRDTINSLLAQPVVTVGDEYNGFQANFTPSFAINVHNGWALNFGFGGINYRTITWESGVNFPSSERNINVTFGQQFNVGISKNFNCAKKKAPREPGMDTRGHKHDHEDEDEDDE